jgi:hypothetical protein
MRKHPNLTREDDLEWVEQSHGEKFGFRRKSLSAATRGEKLGCKYLREMTFKLITGMGRNNLDQFVDRRQRYLFLDSANLDQ